MLLLCWLLCAESLSEFCAHNVHTSVHWFASLWVGKCRKSGHCCFRRFKADISFPSPAAAADAAAAPARDSKTASNVTWFLWFLRFSSVPVHLIPNHPESWVSVRSSGNLRVSQQHRLLVCTLHWEQDGSEENDVPQTVSMPTPADAIEEAETATAGHGPQTNSWQSCRPNRPNRPICKDTQSLCSRVLSSSHPDIFVCLPSQVEASSRAEGSSNGPRCPGPGFERESWWTSVGERWWNNSIG